MGAVTSLRKQEPWPFPPSADRKHALLSPSGAHRWMACPGSVVMESCESDDESEFAKEGTAAHDLASMVLSGSDISSFVGNKCFNGVEYTADMATLVQTYVDAIHERVGSYAEMGAKVELHVEQEVPIGHVTGEDGATGTSDAILLVDLPDGTSLIDVWDLKFGRGVEVGAENNKQLQLYALGAVEKFGLVADFKRVRMNIHQPKISPIPKEWEITIEELAEFSAKATLAAVKARLCNEECDTDPATWEGENLVPGDEQCRFCKARATCPALARFVADTVGAEFSTIVDLNEVPFPGPVLPDSNLSEKMSAIDLIEAWCKSVRAEVERRLLAGVQVPGYKLVQGKRGARQWGDIELAEEKLKSFRLKKEEMYEYKLISPTTAETLLKKDSPKRWNVLQAYICQSEGKPSVAPESDKRPALAITPVADDFASVAADVAGDLV